LTRTRLFRTFDSEVVDHHAQEPVSAGDDERQAVQCKKSGVDTCYNALSSSFFVPGRSW